jgi:hypothetical protein
MALPDLTTSAVAKAIEEFDQLGRDSFLRKYGFGQARSYVLQRDGHSYDSKAIAGAAHGYLPDRAPLKPNEFSAGEATVATVLEQLGFTVIEKNTDSLPSPGDVLGNEQIGRRFGVGNMGGMRRSKGRNLLVLISDPFKGLYQDRWEGQVLHYTGMGPSGPQSLSYAQNRTLADVAEEFELLAGCKPLNPRTNSANQLHRRAQNIKGLHGTCKPNDGSRKRKKSGSQMPTGKGECRVADALK